MKKILATLALGLIGLSLFAQNIGRVNFSELVQLMPEADEARATLQASQQEAEETYTSMVEEYQGKMNQYQQKNTTWTTAIREAKEKELYDIQNRIQEFQQTISQELQQQQTTLMAPLYQKAQEVVNSIAKGKGLAVVFDSTSALYFDEAQVVDLTAEARKALNIADDRTMESLQAELAAKAQQ